MSRALTVDNILNKKYDDIQWAPEFKKVFGVPEKKGTWIIWGDSGHGKTSFAMQLAKELTKSGKVAYLSLEEGDRKTMKMSLKRQNMIDVRNKFVLLVEGFEELKNRLRKRRSPDIIFIDSFQYTGMSKLDYIKFKNEFCKKKLIIFISHSEGRLPEGRAAKFCMFDSDLKIRVEGYKASVKTRAKDSDTDDSYTIWEEGAKKHWGGTE